MKALDELKDILEDQMKKIAKKGDITPQELEVTYKAVDIIKDIETIDAMKEAGYGEASHRYPYAYDSYDMSNRGGRGMSMNYSEDSYGRRGRDGDGDGRYSEDDSYRRGRDAMGRYTSRDSYEGRDGYSGHMDKEQAMQRMEMLDKERQELQQKISRM